MRGEGEGRRGWKEKKTVKGGREGEEGRQADMQAGKQRGR